MKAPNGWINMVNITRFGTDYQMGRISPTWARGSRRTSCTPATFLDEDGRVI